MKPTLLRIGGKRKRKVMAISSGACCVAGDFSPVAQQAADIGGYLAKIALIDGPRLVDLLLTHREDHTQNSPARKTETAVPPDTEASLQPVSTLPPRRPAAPVATATSPGSAGRTLTVTVIVRRGGGSGNAARA